jgi:DNA-binding Xre family transcriptional regulator
MIDYEWRLRPLLAEHGVFTAAQLGPLLAEHGVRLSETQVWRLFTGKPERLNLHTLMVLCEILGCTPNDLIRRAEPAASAVRERRSVAGAGVGELVPKKARIAPAGRRSGG